MVGPLALGQFVDTHNGAVSAVATIVIAVFTVVLAWRTGGLFKETAGLREAAEKQREDMLASIAEAARAATATEGVATHMEASAKATNAAVKAAEDAAQAARDQVTIARNSTAITGRAYVFVSELRLFGSLSTVLRKLSNGTFTPIWRNSSKTPTQYGTTNVNKLHVDAGGLPFDFIYPDYGPRSRISIAPNAIVQALPFEFTSEELHFIREKKGEGVRMGMGRIRWHILRY